AELSIRIPRRCGAPKKLAGPPPPTIPTRNLRWLIASSLPPGLPSAEEPIPVGRVKPTKRVDSEGSVGLTHPAILQPGSPLSPVTIAERRVIARGESVGPPTQADAPHRPGDRSRKDSSGSRPVRPFELCAYHYHGRWSRSPRRAGHRGPQSNS